jgi:hypothetical protein
LALAPAVSSYCHPSEFYYLKGLQQEGGRSIYVQILVFNVGMTSGKFPIFWCKKEATPLVNTATASYLTSRVFQLWANTEATLGADSYLPQTKRVNFVAAGVAGILLLSL